MNKVAVLDSRNKTIKVRTYSESKGRSYTALTTYERAHEMVQQGIARVVSPNTIHNLICWKDVKRKVRKRDKGICRYCHGPGDTVDHVDPRAKQGLTNLKNCVCSCRECNELKKDLPLHKFLAIYPDKKHPFDEWPW